MAGGSGRKRPNGRDPGAARDIDRAERGLDPAAGSDGALWDVLGGGGWPDRRIGKLAEPQRSLITRRQLLGLGVSSDMIDRALKRGRLHRLHQGVYSLVPFGVLPPLAREFAAVLACGDRALLSHQSAAAVWGIRPFVDGDIDVTVVGKETGRRRKRIHLHRTIDLHPRDMRRCQQIPIVSPARALLDIAPHTSGRALEWALDQALIKRLTTHTQIKAVLAAYPHSPGITGLRTLLDPDRPTTLTQSPPEEQLLNRLRKAGIQTPEVNAKVGNYTADFLWRPQKVILEIDGYHYHHTRTRFERDHQRDTEHQLHDHLVIRRTPRQLEQNLDALLVQLATILERRRGTA